MTPIAATIVVVRDPSEVAASLRTRNGIDFPQAMVLWLRYLYAGTGNDPEHLLVRDRDFFVDLPGTLSRMAAHVGLPPPNKAVTDDAQAHLDPSLRHHVAEDDERVYQNPFVAMASMVWNHGSIDLECFPSAVTDAIRFGWIRAPIDAELLARARAEVITMRDRIRQRRRQERAAQSAAHGDEAEAAVTAGHRRQPTAAGRGRRRVSDLALSSDSTATASAGTDEAESAVLAIPDGWVIDELTQERLARQLARAPGRVVGVVAETGVLPHGASYRVHAERLCMLPLSDAVEADGRTVRGAVLLRPDVAFEVRDDVVEVEGGSLLVDPGAHVHDPWRPVAPLEDASSSGRPPFPRRPVVVFLACQSEVEALDWARSLVNNLVRRGVEGRLAMLEIAEGLHLTQPCLPSEESIRALRPDVVVALDEDALQVIPVWCDTDRSTVAIELVPDVAAVEELVSWQLGRAQGRLRARIGRQIDAPRLVSLVNRLCAGPHPAPPVDPEPSGEDASARAGAQRQAGSQDGPVTRRSVLVVTGDGIDATRYSLEGLVDHLVAAGHTAHISALRACAPDALREADLLVIGQEVDSTGLSEMFDARRTAGRPTIGHVESSAIASGTLPNGGPDLTPSAARLVTSVDNVTTGSVAMSALLRRLGFRAHLLPVLLTRARAAELRAARRGHDRFSDPVIGWHAGM